MQTITTKFIPCTNTKGDRVKAKTTAGKSVTLGWNYALDVEGNHKAAAQALKNKMQWDYDMVGGSTNTGYVFVIPVGYLTI